MGSNDLDPDSIGLRLEDLAYEAEDGRYGVAITHHGGGIYLVREHGWADDASGQRLVAIFVRLLDAVEQRGLGARVYLCSDYSDYRGSSNATRKAMLRDVVMRPSLGAVAFWGAGFVTRSVAMLLNVALPRLAARPFRTREQALAFLEELDVRRPSRPAVGGAVQVEPERLDAAVLASFLLRNDDVIESEHLAGLQRRVVRPADWCWRSVDGRAGLRIALVDDDVLLVQPSGQADSSGMAVCRVLLDQALESLGLQRVALVLDLRQQQPLGAELAYARRTMLRELAPRVLSVTLVGGPEALEDARGLLLLGSDPSRVRPAFASLDLAFLHLDRERLERERLAMELVLPTDRGELEALVRDQHRALREHRQSLDRLFAFVGRVSWDESYLHDDLAAPPDITASNPYWSVYGALYMMQLDMLDVLRDREARNQELAQAREQAESASRAKSQFLGTVSHELRTPLNAIFGMAALLRDSHLQGDQLRHLDGLEAASGQLARLVSDLLDITRIEEGVLSLRPGPMAIVDAVDELVARWMPVARDKGLSLEYTLAAEVPAMVRADRGRVVQVLSNLIDNAVKFTERGWVRLAIRAPAPGRVVFEVLDSGCGIPARELSTVFERFERGAAGRADVVPGVGLGLSICRQLAEPMNGEIRVRSVLGQGTAFAVELPLETIQGASKSIPAQSPAETVPDDFSDLLVLLAEDDPASRYVAQRLLESLGCQVVVAEDGRVALERLQRGRYDLVFMDCQMPYLDGLEVTRRFRAAEPPGQHTPIFALTAYAFDEDRERMLAAGMDGHEAKPINRARFEQLLRRVAAG